MNEESGWKLVRAAAPAVVCLLRAAACLVVRCRALCWPARVPHHPALLPDEP